MMYNKLTIGDLRALRTMMSNSNAGETIDIGKFPELKKRWAFIVPKLQEYGFRQSNITPHSIRFINEQTFEAFATHIEDWLEDATTEKDVKNIQKVVAFATRMSAIAATISALCALITLVHSLFFA